MKLQQIIDSIEAFAPLSLQESYDNSGLQIGNPQSDVSAALLCLDVTEETMAEALDRGCELIISHIRCSSTASNTSPAPLPWSA